MQSFRRIKRGEVQCNQSEESIGGEMQCNQNNQKGRSAMQSEESKGGEVQCNQSEE